MTFTLPKRQPPLRSHRKRYLYQLLVARSDIGAAHTACDLFLKSVTSLSDDLYYPLFMSVAVCYGRPFTHNEPFGALPTKWGKFEDPNHQQRHDSIIKARHELVAHSDMTVRRAMIIPPNVVTGNLHGRELKSKKIGTQTSYYYYLFTIPMVRDIPNLTKSLGRRINDEIEHLLQESYGEMDLTNAKFPLRIDEGL